MKVDVIIRYYFSAFKVQAITIASCSGGTKRGGGGNLPLVRSFLPDAPNSVPEVKWPDGRNSLIY